MRSPQRLIIVARSHRAVLEAVAIPDGWPTGTAIMLDRRHAERRTRVKRIAIERRERPRRAPPAATWHTLGFIMVEMDRLPPQAILVDGSPA